MGGRYDSLCQNFGAPMPAVGFSLDLDAVADLNAAALEGEALAQALVYGEPGCEMQAQSWQASGEPGTRRARP